MMTYREKKRYFEGYIYYMRKIKGLEYELEKWRTMATSITQKISPVIVNTNEVSSRVERCAIKTTEIMQTIVEDMASAENERRQIFDTINNIRDTRKRELMTLRYINNVPVSKIAIEYGTDENNIYRQLRRTISSVEM